MRWVLALSVSLVLAAGLAAGALPGFPLPTVWATVSDVVDGNTIVIAIVGADTPGWIVGSTETVRYIGSQADGAMDTFCCFAFCIKLICIVR